MKIKKLQDALNLALRGYMLDHKRQVVCVLLDESASVTSDESTYTVPVTVVTKAKDKYRHYLGTATRRNFQEVHLTTKFGTTQCGVFMQEELWSACMEPAVDIVEDFLQHYGGGGKLVATAQAPGHEPLTYQLQGGMYWYEMGNSDNAVIFKQLGIDPTTYCSEYYKVREGGLWPYVSGFATAESYGCLIHAMLGLRKHGAKVVISKK